jgi:aminocarboxymuconate-semialdehyde decarboxylase
MNLKVDTHTHILPEKLPRFKDRYGYGGFVELDHHAPCRARMLKDDGTFFREVGHNTWDCTERRRECSESGVGLQVLSTVPVMFSYWAKAQDALDLSRFLNDHIADCVRRQPKHFVGLGTLPMQDTDLAIQEAERCMKDLGLVGFQIGTNIERRNLSDPSLFPLYERLESLGAAIFIHPWGMMAQESMQKYWLPWLVGMPAELSLAFCSLVFGGVLSRYPKLRLALAHGGGSVPATLGRIAHGFEARPDLCAMDSRLDPRVAAKRFFVDSLVHDPRVLKLCLDVFGESQVMLGTDYPFPLGEESPGRLIEETIQNEALRKALLCDNALRWLGLSKENFAL